ncbi:MAG: dihydropteroate synthase [Blastocatellia bacterium]|nr:dihydropteroate synthase [Blastocatellia bacterium]
MLLKRTEDRGGFWQPITGRVEPGESWQETALRETGEETGISPGTGRLLDLHYTHSYPLKPEWLVNYPPGTTHNDEAAFALLVPPATSITHDPEEHSQAQWFSFPLALDHLIWHGNREALQRLPAKVPVRPSFAWHITGRTLPLGSRTFLMGILNLTPDSFSDGGRYQHPERAIERALELQSAGADLIDLGAESTRPGSQPVSMEEELARIIPVLEGLQGKLTIPISIDTTKSEVAQAALRRGASIINDISGLRFDARLAELARDFQAGLILMHSLGTPETLHLGREYPLDVCRTVERGWQESLAIALRAQVKPEQIVLDPGFGFGKDLPGNVSLLARLRELQEPGYPILVGTSRKSFLGKLTGKTDPAEREWATAASVTAAVLEGAHLVRVHDVLSMKDCVAVADALLNHWWRDL